MGLELGGTLFDDHRKEKVSWIKLQLAFAVVGPNKAGTRGGDRTKKAQDGVDIERLGGTIIPS